MCVCACVCSVKEREKSVYQYLCAQDNIISIYRWLRCVWWDVCRSFSHPYCFPFSLHMWWVQALVALSPHHTWTLLGPGKGLLWVCVCVLGGIAWRFLFFIFHVSIQQGNVLPYLGHHGVRETAWYCSQENTSFSWQRRTGHCLSLELLLLTDELKIPQRRWDACRKADARRRALIRRSSANTPITFLFISFFSDKACELFLSSPGVGTEQTWIFMCTDVCIFACLSTVTCGTEKGKETDTFSISISPSFRSLQTHNVLRLMCVRVGSSVCDCKGGGIGIGRKVKHYLTALCSDW